jgi:hypothetical protein
MEQFSENENRFIQNYTSEINLNENTTEEENVEERSEMRTGLQS